MATPHVAGVIALMRCANPTLDAITIKQIIMDTALDIDAPGNDNNAGHGMIDALACVLSSINGYGSVSGVVTGNGSPIPAVVSVQGGPQSVTCDIDGNYSMGLPGVFTPVVLDGRTLIDGGGVNPLPHDLLTECDYVVAVDVMGSLDSRGPASPNLVRAVLGTFDIMQNTIIEQRRLR